MPRRDRFAFFLRPERPAEFASVLSALSGAVDGSLSVDLTEDLGMVLQGLDASNIAMVRMRAPRSAFVEYALREPAHLDVSCADLGVVLRGYSGDLILYQLATEPDLLTVEKIDAASKWTLRLTDKPFEHFEIPAAPARASLGYSSGKRLAGALSEMKVALGDAADAVTFSIDRSNGWVVKCGGEAGARRFAQRLAGDDVLVPPSPVSAMISGRHLLSFLRAASVAKGPASLRVIDFGESGDMFCVTAASSASEFEVEMYIAPRET